MNNRKLGKRVALHGNTERLAKKLRDMAMAGLPMPMNLIYTLKHQGFQMGATSLRAARDELLRSGRLVAKVDGISSIDGLIFGSTAPKSDEVEMLKAFLRREYRPVYDPRTTDNPFKVPKGRPEELVVGSLRLTIDQAYRLAKNKASQRHIKLDFGMPA